MAHVGYYINLDRSPDRRAAIEDHLRRLDPPAPYARFAGIDGNARGVPQPFLTNAQTGCFTSHYLLLRSHLDRPEPVHVIEDDAVLARRATRLIGQVIETGLLDEVDILFTSSYLPEDFRAHRAARNAWASRVVRAADGTAANVHFMTFPYFAGMESYLVNPRSLRLVCDLLARELAGGARGPIDLFIRDMVAHGKLRAHCLFPFISSVSPGSFDSTIDRGDAKRRWTLVMDMLRHSFFVECDQRATADLADRLLGGFDTDPQARLHARIAGFLSSDAWQTF